MPSADPTDVISGNGTNWLGLFAGSWAVIGFSLIIGRAVLGMSPSIHETLLTPLSGMQLATYGAATVVFGVIKGYFVFHERFCPRYASRIHDLCQAPTHFFYAVLAPLFCLSLIGTDRAGLLRGYVLVTGIAAMVVSTKLLPFPLRGMLITGVAMALTWAALEIIYYGALELASLYRRHS